MELVLKTSGQQCLVGSNPTASALYRQLSGSLVLPRLFLLGPMKAPNPNVKF